MIINDIRLRGAPCDGVLEDCYRMQKVLSHHYILNISEIFTLWREYSNDRDASWLMLYENDEFLLNALMEQLCK